MKATQEVKAFLKAAASLGGKARAKARTKAQRTAQARTAARARWSSTSAMTDAELDEEIAEYTRVVVMDDGRRRSAKKMLKRAANRPHALVHGLVNYHSPCSTCREEGR